MANWKPVVGFEDRYEISDEGEVRNFITGKLLSGHISSQGYPSVSFKINRKSITRTRHSLVAEAFIGPRKPGYVVRHGDKGKLDSSLDNLKYGTYAENSMDMVLEGKAGRHQANKTYCRNGHEYSEANTYRPPGRNERSCRKCNSANQKRYLDKKGMK